ncbi:hypothetical protein M0O54_10815 [Acinetobacter lactucae]|uniref:Uncharacterized protein n=1 Tax=Acinetobacter lactucae TaxID=1785128 RepID=A0AB35K4X9_9GAMM|nr:hypothetical protein [Acinetobacter lactucae]MDD9320604.1 hypothetical protein [Acinetobacter lactucae]
MNKKLKATFRNKPYPLAIEMRPLWRICLVILIIKNMIIKNRATDLKKLNILLWMTIKHQNRQIFERFLLDKNAPIPFISSDQANYVAIELAFNKDFIKLSYDEKIYLTSKSEHLYNLIIENNLFKDEIDFMSNFGYRLTQKNIDKIIGKS